MSAIILEKLDEIFTQVLQLRLRVDAVRIRVEALEAPQIPAWADETRYVKPDWYKMPRYTARWQDLDAQTRNQPENRPAKIACTMYGIAFELRGYTITNGVFDDTSWRSSRAGFGYLDFCNMSLGVAEVAVCDYYGIDYEAFNK